MKMTQTTFESKNTVPTSIAQLGITMKYTLLDYVRSRRFYILLAITLGISALLTFAIAYYRPEEFLASNFAFYSGWWGNTATFVVVLSAVFFGGDAISGEFQNKTGYFGIPNPIRRSSIYIGKWLSAFIASTLILGIFAAITVSNGVCYFGAIPIEFVESVLFSWFYLVAVLGFTFLFSSLFKSSAFSILVTAILFLFAFNIIELVVTLLVGVEPWFLLSYGAGIIGNVLTVPYPTHTIPIPQSTRIMYNVAVPEGLAIIGIYFIITTVIGLVLFERKEFN
jgi:ABC-2 type transport system permease protein